MRGCLAEDDLQELVRGRALGDAPDVEAHLADCPACSALLVALLGGVRQADAGPPRWGALAGRALGPYRLEAQIGAGAMGAVYRAWDERLRRNVAVKVLPAHAAPAGELARRLEIEARAVAAIAHPNVVTIHDVGSDGGVAYVVEELVDGETLRSVLARGPLGAARARRLAIDLARGLAAAHAQGVVHRDLKPENLLVTEDGSLKILDFGLAKLDEDLEAGDVTEPGTVRGTVGYMAPEQARGEPADARCDLFAAGAILYELCTGRRAFDGASHAERLSAVLRDTPPLDGTPGALAPIIARCLEKDPRRRFQSAADLAWALEQPAVAPPAPPRLLSRRGFLVGAAGGAGLLAGRLLLPRGAPVAPPGFRQLTYRHGRISSARFTHDGGTLLYGAAWDEEPLTTYLLRLDGGVARRLDVPAGDVLAVSSRGDVALGVGRRFVQAQSAVGRLVVAPLDGGAPRELLDEVQDADFTPDGAELAIARRGGRGFRLELPAGRVLLDVAGWITDPRVSPDGRWVACLVHPSVADDMGELVMVERASGRARTLSTGWSSIAGLAWDPGGDKLWLSATRRGADNFVHSVSLDGHERAVVQTPGRLHVHDVASGGRLAISTDVWRLRTRVGDATGERDLSLSEASLATDLSADGRMLLTAELGEVEVGSGGYVRPVDGRPALRVGAGMPIALSPGGTRVASVFFDETVAVYSTASVEQPPLALGAITQVRSGRWLDEQRLVVTAQAGSADDRIWLLETGGAPPSPITDAGRAGKLELDAARRRLAFIDADGKLCVVDIASRALRTLPGSFAGRRVCGWLGDPDAIVVRTLTTPLEVSRVDPASGAATPIREIAPPRVGLRGVDAFLWRGGVYAYSYGQEISQLYLMTLPRP